jgi:hypothetical protein
VQLELRIIAVCGCQEFKAQQLINDMNVSDPHLES